MSKFIVGPTHVLKVGVITKFPVKDVKPALVPENTAMLPFPLAPIPIVVLELVQVTVAPAGVDTKFIASVFVPGQTV